MTWLFGVLCLVLVAAIVARTVRRRRELDRMHPPIDVPRPRNRKEARAQLTHVKRAFRRRARAKGRAKR